MSTLQRKPKILIVGVSGFLGYNLALRLRKNFYVAGICFRHETYLSDTQVFPIDLAKPDLLEPVIRVYDPDFVINAVGMNDRKQIELNPKVADNLNILMAVSLSGLTSKMRRKFVQLSCSSVYDGIEGEYREEDNDFTMNDEMGKQKVAAETYIRTQTLESTILRVGKVVGLGHPYCPSEFDLHRTALAEKQTILVSKKKVRSFLTLDSLSRALTLLLAGEIPSRHRVFNIGGANLTEFDFYERWARLVTGGTSLVKAIPDDRKSNQSIVSTSFATTYPEWKPETEEELYLHLLEELSPGLGVKKWRKTLQIQ